MERNERKLLTSLHDMVRRQTLTEAIGEMWRQGLLNRSALERLYIRSEVARRVRMGEMKVKAIEQLSTEMSCSYEKVRAAVYRK